MVNKLRGNCMVQLGAKKKRTLIRQPERALLQRLCYITCPQKQRPRDVSSQTELLPNSFFFVCFFFLFLVFVSPFVSASPRWSGQNQFCINSYYDFGYSSQKSALLFSTFFNTYLHIADWYFQCKSHEMSLKHLRSTMFFFSDLAKHDYIL